MSEHQRRARRALGVGVVALLSGVAASQAAMEVTAPNGRRVLLREDHTWEYVEQRSGGGELVLTVVKRTELANGCRLGLKLANQTAYQVQSIVPQFSALTRGGVVFETIFAAFTMLKPTKEQYQEITFKGIRCEDVARITVHGADRCTVGDLTRFSPATGECLRHIRVTESDLISISK